MGIGWLCCRFGRHMLTRFGTLSTHLDTLLYQLIVSCNLSAILSALMTQIGTETTHPVMKRRPPKHVIGSGRAPLGTVQK